MSQDKIIRLDPVPDVFKTDLEVWRFLNQLRERVGGQSGDLIYNASLDAAQSSASLEPLVYAVAQEVTTQLEGQIRAIIEEVQTDRIDQSGADNSVSPPLQLDQFSLDDFPIGALLQQTRDSTVSSLTVLGNDGILVGGSPLSSSGTITLDLGNITPLTVSTGTISTTGYIDQVEITPPTNPAANTLRHFVSDEQGLSVFASVDSNGFQLVKNRDIYEIARNTSGTTINKGEAVYISGVTGNVINIAKARANSLITMPCIGLAAETIANNNFGRIFRLGLLKGVNTSAFADGDALFVSPTTAGLLQTTAPSLTSAYPQQVGVVVRSGVGNGQIAVNVVPELVYDYTQTLTTNIGGTGLAAIGAANQVLGVSTGGTALEYKSISPGTGISVTPAAGSLTIATNNIPNTSLQNSSLTIGSTNIALGGTALGLVGLTTVASSLFYAGLGAVNIPSYTFDGDFNTGFWSPAGDTIALSTAGVERLRVDSVGRVLLRDTTSRAVSTGVSSDLQVSGPSPGGPTGISFFQYTGDGAGSALFLLKSRGTTTGTNTIVQNGDTLGSIIFEGANGTGYTRGAIIQSLVDGTPGASNDMPTRLVFFTTPDGSGTPVERLRIGSTGSTSITATGVVLNLGGYTATANQDVFVLQPSNFGTGNPYLSLKKSSTANLWEMIIWDGANTNGTIQVSSQFLQHNGQQALFTGALRSSSATSPIGYNTGAGGTVTQATSKSTGVTLNRNCGEITMNGAALAANTTVTFTLTNSAISAGDVLILNHSSGGTAGSYLLNAQCGAGSAAINVRNITGASLSEAIVIRFAVIEAVTA